jgi:pimeloyl-ACP methyl ester carboxylesterase
MAKNSKKPASSLKIPKAILITGKFLSLISSKWTTLFAAKLFTTPIKHRIPKREMEMDAKTKQELVLIPTINKKIMVYHLGESPKKILLVHGWSGRGTQLVKIADAFLNAGYATISFDAPAHGKSPGKTTLMVEFIAAILHLEKQFGPFEAAIGHSLGGMSLLNAMRQGLPLRHLVIIGSGDIIKDIMDDFTAKLQLNPKVSERMRIHFEKKFEQTMDSFSAYLAARTIDIPVLVIHDNDDDEVPVKCSIHIHKNLQNGELMITKGLGHRKILGDKNVIDKTLDFIIN